MAERRGGGRDGEVKWIVVRGGSLNDGRGKRAYQGGGKERESMEQQVGQGL